jgi:hypothetical protein
VSLAPAQGGGLPSRAELVAATTKLLSRGGWGNPDVRLVELGGRPIVVKDYGPRPLWVRWTFAAFLLRRELRAYRALEGEVAVPRLLGVIDALAFALEYRPGEPLGRGLAARLNSDFMARLRDAVARMHARGVVHLDLRHRSNVLVDEQGGPVLIDFASALCFRPGGLAARWWLPWLARIDWSALRKWESRLAR